MTNQFKLTLHSKYVIFTYAIEAHSDQPDAKLRVREMVQKLDKELKLCFLHYIYSGQNIFSPTSVDEFELKCMLGTHSYYLKIWKVGSFNLDHIEKA